MFDDTANPDAAWGLDFPELELPCEQDLAAIRALAEGRGQDPWKTAQAAGRGGLLKDLACFFAGASGRSGSLARRRVQDLGELIDRFGETALALGFDPCPPGPPSAPVPELRLRECRIDRCASSAEVHWPVKFEHCVWPAPATFMGVHFLASVSFVGATFLSAANFFAVTFQGDAFFGGACFLGEADFRGASFQGEVSFLRADFRQSLELKYAEFLPTSTLNIHELRFRGSAALAGGLSLRCTQIRTGRWPRFRGRIAGEHSSNVRELALACEQYGELAANFAAQGSPDAADAQEWCHYRYMDLRRRSHRRRFHPVRMLDWLFLKWCFGYGLHTKRILITGLVAIFLFASLYFTNGLGLPPGQWGVIDGASPPNSIAHVGPWYVRLGNALYFSAITFTTIGYGDLHPVHWAKLAGAIEGVLGVFLMAVFTVSFARKMLR